MNTEQQVTYDQIKTIVSGGVGQNHSLIGNVEYQDDCLGVRKVQISIVHEASTTGKVEGNQEPDAKLDVIKGEMAPIIQQITANLDAAGHSVTKTEDLTSFINQNNRAVIQFRCSLKPILKQQAPPPETSTADLAINPDQGPAIQFGQ